KSLEDGPETINSDPYGEGWMVAIEAPDVEEQVKKLMNAEQYAERTH
ncbi:MAG: glycine cleavage system protein H, partial [Candidatus Odinarchaeia archaeon]